MSNVKMATAVSTAALKSEKVPHRAKSKEEQGVRENLGWLAATPGILRMGAGVLVRVYVQVKRAVLAHSRVYLVADRGTSVSNDSSGPRDIEILPHSMVMVELVRNSHWFVRSERWHSADVVQDTLRKPQVKLAGMILTSADKLLCGFNNALTAFGKHYVLAANNCRNFSRVFLDHLSLSTDGRPVTVSEHVIDRATDWAMGPFEKMYAAVTSKPTGERGLQLLRSSLQAKSTPSTPGGGDPVVGEADTAQDTRRKLLRQLSDRGKQAFTTATANDAPANDAAGNGAANQAKPGGTGDTGGTGHGSGGGSSPPAKQGSTAKETATLLGGGAGVEALKRCPRDVRVAAAAAMAAPVVLTAVQLRGTYKKLEAGDINTRDAAYRTGKHSAGAVVGVAGAGAAVAVGVTMAASAPLLAVAAGAGVAGVVVKVTAEAAVDAVTSIGKEVFSNNKRTNGSCCRGSCVTRAASPGAFCVARLPCIRSACGLTDT